MASEKAFKLNGTVSVEEWSRLCTQFLSGNPLITEYYTGHYPNHIRNLVNQLRSN